MARETDRYTYRVTWSEEDGEYVGLCAEFPSLSWLEKTPEKTLVGIRHLVQQTILDLKKTGEELPEPISMKSFAKLAKDFISIYRVIGMQRGDSRLL